ncbi:cyclic diguanylate phosphodiesterase [Craterilacuibacter sp. RT1T]|uniref:EAL domain-containing protein n=1 Tax=Craterilacuibacter sp. RT1T TaxID=2942211 RepID=UPI0020BE6970|nr:cyclic diguanylate phosphodiesterase [Craterilacuibacter sp. RT1T]MCL6264172.1 cyclic diguanylate phosphodiesterase [Craterilacuibacter sp. RT1T]
MPLTESRIASHPRRLVLALLAVLLPAMLGWGITLWTSYHALHARLVGAVNEAHHGVEHVFESSEQAARASLSLVGKPCDEQALFRMRELVTTVLYVRSISLGRGDHYYCSSLFGRTIRSADMDAYVDGRTRLRPGNSVTPDQAVLSYRLATENGDFVVVGVSGGHLRLALRHGVLSEGVQLQIGSRWMDSNGDVHDGAPPRSMVLQVRRTDTKYPFTVLASVAWPTFLRASWEEYQPMLVLVLLLGLAAGWGVYQWGQKPQLPARIIGDAVARREFMPFLQPLFDAQSGRVCGAEALVRWMHPRYGLLSPATFIEEAERSGQMGEITRQLLLDVAAALAPYAERLPDGFHLAFNLDAEQLNDPQLLIDCRRFIDAFPQGKVRLTLELTEREAFDGHLHADVFARLRAEGIELAIDDFGTGQSSLAYLHELSVDTLKIDRTFVDAIGRDSLGKIVLDAIISLGQELKLKLVAGGVETEAQRDYLAAAGVDLLQGYLLARPMPLADFIRTLPEPGESV